MKKSKIAAFAGTLALLFLFAFNSNAQASVKKKELDGAELEQKVGKTPRVNTGNEAGGDTRPPAGCRSCRPTDRERPKGNVQKHEN